MLKIRRSSDRGLASHGWLTSRHTFSFAEYFDPAQMGFGPLRVINEDRIKGGTGFGSHPHRDMEIITYVIDGALAHRDSLGTEAVIRPDEVQRMTAGTGIVHSEMNAEAARDTHFFQIWIKPERAGLVPSYGQRSFAKELAGGTPVLVLSRDGRENSVAISQDVDLYITRFKAANVAEFNLDSGRSAWVQVISGEVQVEQQQLAQGDAAAVTEVNRISISADQAAEFMLFVMKPAR